jgi:hypothetical protein
LGSSRERSLADWGMRQQNSEPLESHSTKRPLLLTSRKDQLQAGIANLTVIVVGVLLALAAEAAWAERGDRIREQEVLVDLLEDFRENYGVLLSDIEQNRVAKEAARAWADVALDHSAASPDSAHALLVAAQQDARFDPITGALRSLLDGGELHVIQNQSLRQALAGWTDRTEEARLTALSYDAQRQSLVSLVLGFPPSASLAPRQRSAVLLLVEITAGQQSQLEALVERVAEIITLLEREID